MKIVVLSGSPHKRGTTARLVDSFVKGAIEKQIRKHQKTVFITAMADDNQETINAANDSYRAIVRWLEWNDCGILNAFACTTPEDLNGTDYEAKAYDLGKNIG